MMSELRLSKHGRRFKKLIYSCNMERDRRCGIVVGKRKEKIERGKRKEERGLKRGSTSK